MDINLRITTDSDQMTPELAEALATAVRETLIDHGIFTEGVAVFGEAPLSPNHPHSMACENAAEVAREDADAYPYKGMGTALSPVCRTQ